MANKFYYIKRRDLDMLHQLFESKDPDLRLVLNEFGDYADTATYSPKYETVVFSTVKKSLVRKRL